MSKRDELNITRCMMLGCTFVHNDFGHPERAAARNHYQCVNHQHGWWIGWGHNEAEAAYDYLRRYYPKLLVR